MNPKIDELNQAGCERIFRDKVSGVKTESPGLQEAMHFLYEGNTLAARRLDRLGRSPRHPTIKISQPTTLPRNLGPLVFGSSYLNNPKVRTSKP